MDGHGQQQYSGRLWRLKDAQLVLRVPKCAKKISPTPLHHHQPEQLRQGRMDPYFHVLYAKFWSYHLNVAAEIETHQTRQRFSNLLFSNFGEYVRFVAKWVCAIPVPSYQERHQVWSSCCCRPSASRVRRVVRSEMYSAYSKIWCDMLHVFILFLRSRFHVFSLSVIVPRCWVIAGTVPGIHTQMHPHRYVAIFFKWFVALDYQSDHLSLSSQPSLVVVQCICHTSSWHKRMFIHSSTFVHLVQCFVLSR